MRTELTLRTLDPAVCALRNEALKAGITGIDVVYLSRDKDFVVLASSAGEQRHRVFVPLQQLVDLWLQDASIPAEHIDRDIALQFMREALASQGLPAPSEHFCWEAVVGFASKEDRAAPVLHMQGGPFDLYLDHLPSGFDAPVLAWPALPVQTRWVMAGGVVAGVALAELAVGDVMRVPLPCGVLYAGEMPLFAFFIQGDLLMLDDPQDHAEPEGDDTEEHADAAGHVSLAALPVNVSFVLGRRNMTVGDIGTLAVGTTLALDQITPCVDVMAGGVLLARGELVRIGESLGVEIQRLLTPPPREPDDTAS